MSIKLANDSKKEKQQMKMYTYVLLQLQQAYQNFGWVHIVFVVTNELRELMYTIFRASAGVFKKWQLTVPP